MKASFFNLSGLAFTFVLTLMVSVPGYAKKPPKVPWPQLGKESDCEIAKQDLNTIQPPSIAPENATTIHDQFTTRIEEIRSKVNYNRKRWVEISRKLPSQAPDPMSDTLAFADYETSLSRLRQIDTRLGVDSRRLMFLLADMARESTKTAIADEDWRQAGRLLLLIDQERAAYSDFLSQR